MACMRGVQYVMVPGKARVKLEGTPEPSPLRVREETEQLEVVKTESKCEKKK